MAQTSAIGRAGSWSFAVVCLALHLAVADAVSEYRQHALRGESGDIAAGAAAAPHVPVTLVFLEGCGDCENYGADLADIGFKAPVDLARSIDLKVLLVDGAIEKGLGTPALHKFAACAGSMPKDYDSELTWFKAFLCAHADPKRSHKCDKLRQAMPKKAFKFIQECEDDDNRSSRLVKEMHREAASREAGSFPWVDVAGKVLPPPDEDEDDVRPTLHAVCEAIGKSAPSGCHAIPRHMSGEEEEEYDMED